MRIRESQSIARSTSLERQEQILESIAELEQQHEDGTIETHAYFLKKRSLIKML